MFHRATNIVHAHTLLPVLATDHARHRERIDHEDAEHVSDARIHNALLRVNIHRRKRTTHTSARTLAPLLSKLRIQLANQPSSFEILLRIEGRK